MVYITFCYSLQVLLLKLESFKTDVTYTDLVTDNLYFFILTMFSSGDSLFQDSTSLRMGNIWLKCKIQINYSKFPV